LGAIPTVTIALAAELSDPKSAIVALLRLAE
jgi:hypothetical protein